MVDKDGSLCLGLILTTQGTRNPQENPFFILSQRVKCQRKQPPMCWAPQLLQRLCNKGISMAATPAENQKRGSRNVFQAEATSCKMWLKTPNNMFAKTPKKTTKLKKKTCLLVCKLSPMLIEDFQCVEVHRDVPHLRKGWEEKGGEIS